MTRTPWQADRDRAEHARVCSLPFGHQGGHWWDERQEPVADSGYRAFHNDCGGMVAFGPGGGGFCVACEDENVGFKDYTLVAVRPSEPEGT